MNPGTDILVLNGDIIFDGDTLAIVSGDDNVQQQAYLCLLADKGESIFFPDYGTFLHGILAKPCTDENAAKAEAEARTGLLRVGDASGGQGWIEEVLDCRLLLTEVDGKAAKMLFARYRIRGDSTVRELKAAIKV